MAGDGAALLSLKAQVTDPNGVLADWGVNANPCSWRGVNCTSAGDVQGVALSNSELSGWLDLYWLASLPMLQFLDLSGNQFTTNFSGIATSCATLRLVNLSSNSISASLPPSFFTNCGSLQTLDLSHNLITGNLPTSIGSSLLYLLLSHNFINGQLPSTFLSNCTDCSTGPPLLSLDISNNHLAGTFPDQFFAHCPLFSLDLSVNNLSGSLPTSLQNCNQLVSLNLTSNILGPSLPDFLGSLTNIRQLYLSGNQFSGAIPQSLVTAPCLNMQELVLSNNNFSGSIPGSLAACQNLQLLNLASNMLSGDFPTSVITQLQSLQALRLSFNSFTGSVPVAVLVNCTRLQILDLGGNFLTGAVPAEICPPSNTYVLEQLLLANNKLSGGVPATLSNCHGLVILDLSFNQLGGSIPVELSSLPNLERISLWYTGLTGEIPPALGNIPKLRNLNLNNNFLSGTIPWQLSNCSDLEWLNLNSNLLSGGIPPQFGLLQKLTILELGNNSLTGPIPSELGNCSNLLWLDLNTNQLNGTIPNALGRHSTEPLSNAVLVGDKLAYVRKSVSCRGFGMGTMLDFTGVNQADLANTPFTACQAMPTLYEGGSLYDNSENRTIQYLDLSFNQLSGSIPEQMGSWVSLIILALSHNQLSGAIPATFGNLRVLGVMDLSFNQLDGSLSVLASCSLLVFIDVSNNNFSGSIPSGQLSTTSNESFANNPFLCGTPLPACTLAGADQSNSQTCTNSNCSGRNRLALLTLTLGILGSLLCVCAFVVWIGVKMKNSRREKATALLSSLHQYSSCHGSGTWNFSGEREPLSINVATFERPLRKLTFSQLVEATNGFSKESLVGRGGFGEVYKADLKDGSVVAIKKLLPFSFQGDREFLAEMETLGKIKHRNLVPLLGYCKVGEERLLVYEYMQGGNLDEVLHGDIDGRERLTWDLRKQIAKGAARGLAFLHHNCIPHIIHRDMKSSNVLLDKDLEARVSDFGMARLISALDTHLSVSTLAGTPGYVPPEYYQSFRCTTKGDVYSFGVVLLELVTGKRPTDKEEFGDNNLVGWVKLHVASKNSLEVLDPLLKGTGVEYEMIQYLNIACDCVDDLPAKRPTMFGVVARLKELSFQDQSLSST